jgi:hypothetical protein
VKTIGWLFVAVFVAWGSAAHAQGYIALPSGTNCGDPRPPAGIQPGYQDSTGKVCVDATVSASVAVAPLTSTNLSSTIAVTNTFQSIQVSTAGRNGCTVQNNDTNTMWVFFGAIGGATKAKSIVLAAGQAVSCAVGGLGVLTDQISITGTSTGVFFAAVQ